MCNFFITRLYQPLLIVIGIYCSLLLSTSYASEIKNTNTLESLWEEVLQNPTNVEANIDYALEAEALGFHDRAIAAFRRALSIDPKNALARRKTDHLIDLNRPGVISGTLILGTSYNTNASQASTNEKGDKALSNTIVVSGDRNLFGMRWKSSFINFADAHTELRGSDINYTSIKTGPSLNISNGNKINISANIETTTINSDLDSYSFGIMGDTSFMDGLIKNLDYGFKFVEGHSEGSISYFNGFLSSSLHIRSGIIQENDAIQLQPSFSFNINKKGFDSSGSRDRLINLSSSLDYTLQISDIRSVNLFTSPSYSYYLKHRTTDSKDRMDLSAEIGGSFNYSISSSVTFTISLGREQNFSNFNEFEYTNYHAESSLVYTF